MENKVSYLVSVKTGEIQDEIREGDRVRITRKKSIEHLEQYDDWKLEHFYKGHTDEIRKLMQSLSLNEKAFLFAVVVYVGYEDCCLKHSNGNDITPDDLPELVGMGKSLMYETLNSLVKKEVLYRGKNGTNRQIFINPWLFCKGNRINKVLKTMFKNYKVRVCGNIPWKHLP